LAILDRQATVNGLAFSGDGEILAAGRSDESIVNWRFGAMGGFV
jgi:hypothetical protein